MKENLSKAHTSSQASQEAQQAAFARERAQMMEKIENMTKMMTMKDREIVTTKTKLESHQEQLKKKDKVNEDKAREM